MTRDEIIGKLRAHEADLKAEGVAHLFLFGSYARGEADAASDVDLFFDYAPGTAFSLLDRIGVKHRLEDILECSVDALTRRSLHPMVAGRAESEAVRVF